MTDEALSLLGARCTRMIILHTKDELSKGLALEKAGLSMSCEVQRKVNEYHRKEAMDRYLKRYDCAERYLDERG